MENSLEYKLRTLLRETFVSEVNDEDKTKEKEKSEDKPLDDRAQAMYSRIQQVLKNDLINHAAIVRRLWGDNTSSGRSKFRKKLLKEPTESGDSSHHFNSNELIEINRILMNLGSDAISGLGGGRRKQKKAVKAPSNDPK